MIDDKDYIHPDWNPHSQMMPAKRAEVTKELRGRCPVALAVDSNTGKPFWSVLRYDDIVEVTRDTETFSNGKKLRLAARRAPLESDPPEHTQYRKYIQAFFAPRPVQSMESISRDIARGLVDTIIRNGGGDAAADFARPMPPQVLLEWLGQPREDWSRVKFASDRNRPRTFKDDSDRESFQTNDADLWQYSREVVEDRKRNPRDPLTDPVSALLKGKIDGQPVDEQLVVGTVRLLVAAGHDSTSQSMGICICYLARNQDAQDMLRADPSKIRFAIEEILRVETPIVSMPRIVTADVELQGRTLRAGDRVQLDWASANRDETKFTNPNEVDLERRPNPHLVFGHGAHTCVGAPLARQEIRVALEELLSRTEQFSLSGEPHVQDFHHFAYDAIPLAIKPKTI